MSCISSRVKSHLCARELSSSYLQPIGGDAENAVEHDGSLPQPWELFAVASRWPGVLFFYTLSKSTHAYLKPFHSLSSSNTFFVNSFSYAGKKVSASFSSSTSVRQSLPLYGSACSYI